MTNRHRRHLHRDHVEALLGAAGIAPGRIGAVVELPEGMFNTVYRVDLVDGAGVVVKVSPDPAAPILTYEREIMRTEALFYRLAGEQGGLPVPEVLHEGFDQRLLDGDFLVMSRCPGEPWHTVADRLDATHRTELRRELGRLVARLHRMTGGDGFGYPSRAVAPTDPSWRTAFLGMVDAVLADAERFSVPLPCPAGQIRALFDARADPLAEVTTPVLVHFDLWDGNVLLTPADRPRRIGGLIDAERAFWGDPLADLVSLALWENVEEDTAFLEGYRSAGGRVRFDAPTRQRLALYRCYLYLIVWIESAPREYGEAQLEWLRTEFHPRLAAALGALAATDTA